MNKFLNWIVLSSADSTQAGLTVKGILLSILPVASVLLGLAHIHVGDLTGVVDSIVSFVQAGLAVVSSIVVVIGLARKIYRSVTGTNAVTNSVVSLS
jgi:hypothetical protein